MGKSAPAPQPAPLPPVPPPPPPAPVQAVGSAVSDVASDVASGGKSTEELIRGAKTVPATPLDTATAGREEEMAQARKKGRKSTKKTGPTGLLTQAPVYKKGLLGPQEEEEE
ncbi:hypothetical protein CMI37_10065 [Candidatus Pacearchaeota archaeon]|nr:hypothetical protein [Candidatus Pacearchaeota archaeon]